MNEETVSCYKCGRPVLKKRILFQPLDDISEMICGTCIKHERGEFAYNFYKNLLDRETE